MHWQFIIPDPVRKTGSPSELPEIRFSRWQGGVPMITDYSFAARYSLQQILETSRGCMMVLTKN